MCIRDRAGNEYLSGKVRGASFVDENKLDTRKFEEARDYLWAVPDVYKRQGYKKEKVYSTHPFHRSHYHRWRR